MIDTTALELTFDDVIRDLAASARTGALDVTDGTDRKTLYFIDGGIVCATSSDPADASGRRLQLSGLLDDAQLEQARLQSEIDGEDLLDTLYATGVLTGDQVEAVVCMETLEIVWGLFLWPDWQHSYRDGALPESVAAAIHLEAAEVVQEGRRRRLWAEGLRQRFEGPETVVRLRPEARSGASAVERQLVELLQEPRTIAELRAACVVNLSEMLRLLEAVAEPVPKAPPLPKLAPFELVRQARLAIERKEYREGVELFGKAMAERPQDLLLRTLYASAETVYCQVLAGPELPFDRPLKLSCEAADMGDRFRPNSYRLLGRIDGRATIGELLEIGDEPRPETLSAIVELKQWGLIELT